MEKLIYILWLTVLRLLRSTAFSQEPILVLIKHSKRILTSKDNAKAINAQGKSYVLGNSGVGDLRYKFSTIVCPPTRELLCAMQAESFEQGIFTSIEDAGAYH